MEKLYRIFLTILFISFCVTILLQLIPTVKLSERTLVHVSKCIIPNSSGIRRLGNNGIVRPNFTNVSEVWDTSSNHDRILSQIEFIPSGVELNRRSKVIWHRGFDVSQGREVFKSCKISKCTIKTGNSVLEEHIDAKIFNMEFTYLDLEEHRQYSRPPSQVWILYALESPIATSAYNLLDGVFNWTATYRRDSTIVTPYEKWVPHGRKSVTKSTKNYAKNKKNLVAIFVSNCDTTNGRLDYIDQLSVYIDVHVYGDCGNGKYTCDRYENESMCFDILEKQYKFYLSFENANCRDYITEKFFRNALMHGVVPVVMGAHPDDYRQVAPPNSYIHVEDFSSPKELADYLHKLNHNDELYNKYFEWKDTGSFIDTKFWCRLCSLLNDPHKPNLVVQGLSNWWRPPRGCLRQDQRWLYPDTWAIVSRRSHNHQRHVHKTGNII